MPLEQSSDDAARSANIATEIKAGKSRAQAAAIGYAVQRRSGVRTPSLKKTVRDNMAKISKGLR